jgi:hypothetical protein
MILPVLAFRPLPDSQHRGVELVLSRSHSAPWTSLAEKFGNEIAVMIARHRSDVGRAFWFGSSFTLSCRSSGYALYMALLYISVSFFAEARFQRRHVAANATQVQVVRASAHSGWAKRNSFQGPEVSRPTMRTRAQLNQHGRSRRDRLGLP